MVRNCLSRTRNQSQQVVKQTRPIEFRKRAMAVIASGNGQDAATSTREVKGGRLHDRSESFGLAVKLRSCLSYRMHIRGSFLVLPFVAALSLRGQSSVPKLAQTMPARAFVPRSSGDNDLRNYFDVLAWSGLSSRSSIRYLAGSMLSCAMMSRRETSQIFSVTFRGAPTTIPSFIARPRLMALRHQSCRAVAIGCRFRLVEFRGFPRSHSNII